MRFALLTYNPPGGREFWAAMTESERQAEEDEYLRLVEAMHASNAYVEASEFARPVIPGRCVFGTATRRCATVQLSEAKNCSRVIS
jgi:hypothetical protein